MLRKRIHTPGVIFSLYLIMNGVERFFIEKIRVNNRFDLLGFQATQAEIIAVLFMVLGALGIWWFTKRYRLTKNVGVDR
jgi:prolipoprotein diacylglyceryltransferase